MTCRPDLVHLLAKSAVRNRVEVECAELARRIALVRQAGDHRGVVGAVAQRWEVNRHWETGQRFAQATIRAHAAADDHGTSARLLQRALELRNDRVDACRLERGGNV